MPNAFTEMSVVQNSVRNRSEEAVFNFCIVIPLMGNDNFKNYANHYVIFLLKMYSILYKFRHFGSCARIFSKKKHKKSPMFQGQYNFYQKAHY